MTGSSALEPQPGNRLVPAFARANVVDVMHTGLISCPPDEPLASVARTMASKRVHVVVVSALGARHDRSTAWGIVSDLDLARFAGSARDLTAGSVASTDLVTIDAEESLERAAQVMAEHEVSHLVAVDPRTGYPVGVLSTLDLAGVLGRDVP